MVHTDNDALSELKALSPAIVPSRISYEVNAPFFAHQQGKRDIRGFTSGIIIAPGNKVVLAHRGGKWFMPGGGVETGETFAQAMKREIMEEVGIQILDLSLVAIDEETFISPEGEKIQTVLAVFAMKTPDVKIPGLTTGAKEEGIDDMALFEVGNLPEPMALTDREKIISYFKTLKPTT